MPYLTEELRGKTALYIRYWFGYNCSITCPTQQHQQHQINWHNGRFPASCICPRGHTASRGQHKACTPFSQPPSSDTSVVLLVLLCSLQGPAQDGSNERRHQPIPQPDSRDRPDQHRQQQQMPFDDSVRTNARDTERRREEGTRPAPSRAESGSRIKLEESAQSMGVAGRSGSGTGPINYYD